MATWISWHLRMFSVCDTSVCGYHDARAQWFNTDRNVAGIRNLTCLWIRISVIYPFLKCSRLPKTSCFFNVNLYFVYTTPSLMFVRAVLCRICRFKFRQSPQCNKIISICQSFLLKGFTGWPNVLTARWYVIWEDLCIILILRPKMWSHDHLCRLFQLVSVDGNPQTVQQTTYIHRHLGLMFLRWI